MVDISNFPAMQHCMESDVFVWQTKWGVFVGASTGREEHRPEDHETKNTMVYSLTFFSNSTDLAPVFLGTGREAVIAALVLGYFSRLNASS